MAELTGDGNQTFSQDVSCSGLKSVPLDIFISTLNIFISITAVLGNVLIIVALPKVTSLHVSSKLLFRSLACTDLCVGLILQPLRIAFFTSSDDSKSCDHMHLNKSFKMAATVFCGVSGITLAAISVDRLFALLLGLKFRQVVTLRRVWVFVILSWLFSTASAMTYLYSYLITMAIISVGLLLCTVTSTFCYTKIFLTLRNHQSQVQDRVQQEQPNEERTPPNMARYKKTVSSALWVQMTFLACYLPFGISTIVVGLTGQYPPALALAWELTLSLLTFNSSLNPFLYCWKIGGVRKEVKKIIRKFFCLSS